MRTTTLARALAWAAGAAEALLLARLLARLLAARPDSPAFAALYLATWPMVAPLSALDHAQRQFGAALEISTLTTAILVPAITYLLWTWLATRGPLRSS
ncbi:MAG: YggT family protein [Chloroflexales bacterium]